MVWLFLVLRLILNFCDLLVGRDRFPIVDASVYLDLVNLYEIFFNIFSSTRWLDIN